MEKLYVSAEELLRASYELAWQVYESGFRPDYIIGIWRGGAPVGIAIQEFFDLMGVFSDHIAIRTSSYIGIGERNKTVQVHGLNYVIRQVESDNSLLMIDDVFDTGLSVQKVIQDLEKACKKILQTFVLPLPTTNQKIIRQIESQTIICRRQINGSCFHTN